MCVCVCLCRHTSSSTKPKATSCQLHTHTHTKFSLHPGNVCVCVSATVHWAWISAGSTGLIIVMHWHLSSAFSITSHCQVPHCLKLPLCLLCECVCESLWMFAQKFVCVWTGVSGDGGRGCVFLCVTGKELVRSLQRWMQEKLWDVWKCLKYVSCCIYYFESCILFFVGLCFIICAYYNDKLTIL